MEENWKIYIPNYKWMDKHGNRIQHGSYVHYKRGELSTHDGLAEVDGWVLQEYVPCEDDFCLCLYTNDIENNLINTGIYWVFDGQPVFDIEPGF